jgi:ABC-type sugar transport system ATPase subunit
MSIEPEPIPVVGTSATASAPTTATPIVEMIGIGKSFFGVAALADIDWNLRRGEVHALVGENGAGKSTLMKVLAGVHRPDTGTILLDGQPTSFEHPLAAQRARIATVFQEFNLLPERSIAENVFLGREPRRFGLVDVRRMQRDTADVLDDLGINGPGGSLLSPRATVGSLSVAEQQIVEIVKAVSIDARIISMDEPTAALADTEVELLYRLVRSLVARDVSILYVSHRLKEIFDLADRITVLKDGRLVTTADTSELHVDQLVRLMVGRPMEQQFPPKPERTAVGNVRLRITGGGNATVDDIDLVVRAGEIVGLAGLQGSGRTEIAHGVFGVARFARGTVELDGRVVDRPTPRSSARRGLALVSEDRKGEGLALNQSVSANARLVLDGSFPSTAGARSKRLAEILQSVHLRARNTSTEVRFLSGGNQQKVVLAKWLLTDPGVIVLDEPTRGIDVGARLAIYELIRELAADGAAILMISSELPELIGMSDRIVVLHEGRISGELIAADAVTGHEPLTEAAVMAMATGRHLDDSVPFGHASEVPA